MASGFRWTRIENAMALAAPLRAPLSTSAFLLKPEAMAPPSDGESLERLVQENLGWLRGWLRGRVRDPNVVDDLCQESLLKALRRFPDLKDRARFSSWLYRIAENTVRDHLRSENRRKVRLHYTNQLEGSYQPDDLLGKTEEAERLLSEIRALPRRFRDPLLLRHSRDLSYKEIGKILGISENAVQVRIFRARKKLRSGRLKAKE